MPGARDSIFWKSIDGSFVINLDGREDRWDTVTRLLKGFIPEKKYERLSAVNGKELRGYGCRPWFRGREKDFRWAGRAGCTLSHRKAMEAGLRRGWDVFLILEDDLELCSVDEALMDEIADSLFKKHPDWDMCYLGFTNPRGPARTIDTIGDKHRFIRFRGARTTHAYLVKAPLARWLLENFPREENIWDWCSRKRVVDRWYSRNLSRSFTVTCISPSLIIQAPSYSDLVGRVGEGWDELGMLSEVPPSMEAPTFFGVRWFLSGLKCHYLNLLDSVKGTFKRVKGF